MLRRIFHLYPLLTYAAFCLLASVAIDLLSSAGSGYDGGGIGGVAFLLSMIWSVLAFPFSGAFELLFSLNGSVGFPLDWLIASAMGVVLCAVADLILHIIRKHRARADVV